MSTTVEFELWSSLPTLASRVLVLLLEKSPLCGSVSKMGIVFQELASLRACALSSCPIMSFCCHAGCQLLVGAEEHLGSVLGCRAHHPAISATLKEQIPDCRGWAAPLSTITEESSLTGASVEPVSETRDGIQNAGLAQPALVNSRGNAADQDASSVPAVRVDHFASLSPGPRVPGVRQQRPISRSGRLVRGCRLAKVADAFCIFWSHMRSAELHILASSALLEGYMHASTTGHRAARATH